MKILYVTQVFPPEPGASQRPLKQGAWLQELGHKVTVLSTMPYYPLGRIFEGYRRRLIKKEKIEGLDVLRVWSIPASSTGILRRAASQISFAAAAAVAGMALRRYDLVIASTHIMATEMACLLIARLRRSRVLLELRDLIPDSLALAGVRKDSCVARALSAYFEFIYRRVDVIAVPCSSMIALLTERGVSRNRILMLPHGADPEQLNASDGQQMRRRLGLRGKFVLAYAGSFSRYYGVPDLVSSLWRLKGRLPQVHLLLIGTGQDMEMVRSMIKERAQDNVTLVGAVAPREVGSYLQAADVFISQLVGEATPTMYQDQLTTKVCEYLMVGRPVIAVESAPVLGGFLRKIGAGFGVPAHQPEALADAIAFFVASPEECQRYGDHARRFARIHLERRRIVERFEGELVEKLDVLRMDPE